MSNLRPNSDFQYANGPETGASFGSSPGCTNENGDGTFDDPSTGCNKQCPGCGGEWCCDCNGCTPGRCDQEPANTWCQDYYETWGKVAAGCPPPNNDPCYIVDPITSRWVPNTDACFCPGATRIAGKTCNPNTGDWDDTPTNWGTPPADNRDPSDDGPTSGNPDLPGEVVCFLKSVEVFGDYDWHIVPCRCRNLGTPEAVRRCIFPPDDVPVECDCECGYYDITVGDQREQGWSCGEVCNGQYTGRECDIECHCHADCDPGQTCNTSGQCV